MVRKRLCTDPSGVLRGACRRCPGCTSFALGGFDVLRFDTAPPHAPPENCGRDDTSTKAACESCGCPSHHHRHLQSWLNEVRQWVKQLLDTDGACRLAVPPPQNLPVVAKDWDPCGCALYLVTHGQFDPRREGRRSSCLDIAEQRDEDLVSVVCSSIQRNQPSHPLLYECFCRQSYEPRELIVVDSGTTPSVFLQEVAKEDSRVTYCFFFREEHGLQQEEDPLEHVLKADDPDHVLHFVQWTPDFANSSDANRSEVVCNGMTLGLKRNVAVHLAQGQTIIHFNPGDLYTKDYVAFMHSQLHTDFEADGGTPQPPAAVALAEWHALDLFSGAFRLLDPKQLAQRLPAQMRQSMRCARGFTYAHTREAWQRAPFPNVELPEGHFARVLKREKLPFRMVPLSNPLEGLAARVYSRQSLCGVNVSANINISIEIQDIEDCSIECETPAAFIEMESIVVSMADAARMRRSTKVEALLAAEGPTSFCATCDAAIAFRSNIAGAEQLCSRGGKTCDVAQFSRAGGAVASGEKTSDDWKEDEQPKQDWRRIAQAAFFMFEACERDDSGPEVESLPEVGEEDALALAGGSLGPIPLIALSPAVAEAQSSYRQASWFPGWSWRIALCRCCGAKVGWRYERPLPSTPPELNCINIFWVFLTSQLVEKDPSPKVALVDAPPVQTMEDAELPSFAASVRSKKEDLDEYEDEDEDEDEDEEWEVVPIVEDADIAQRRQEVIVLDAKVEGRARRPRGQHLGVEDHGSSGRASSEAASKILSRFSSELRRQLVVDLSSGDGGRFDASLNKLQLDNATRENILQELMLRPDISPLQREQLVLKSFKGKVNTLRSLGLRVICAALWEILPDGSCMW